MKVKKKMKKLKKFKIKLIKHTYIINSMSWQKIIESKIIMMMVIIISNNNNNSNYYYYYYYDVDDKNKYLNQNKAMVF